MQELNDWLRQVDRQHQDRGWSKTFVATREQAPDRICAYTALTLAELENCHLPEAWRKKQRVPITLAGFWFGARFNTRAACRLATGNFRTAWSGQ